MKCKCGGELERIYIDCYKCKTCGLKYAAAFAQLPAERNGEIKISYEAKLNINKINENILKDVLSKINRRGLIGHE